MAKNPVRAALIAGLAWFLGHTAPAHAQVASILKYTPAQPGVQITTPTADEQASCKVQVVAGAKAGSSGYLLTDAKGNKLRAFFDSDGDKKVDMWSYFKDGAEVYREIDTNANNRPDQFRWLGSAGMKWGIDADEDGKIDSWQMISAEEAAEEAFQAMAKNDFARLRALFINGEDIKTLKLPAAEVERLATLQKNAKEKFAATLAKMPQLAAAKFERLESATPSCTPADGTVEKDIIRFNTRLILFQHEAGKEVKHDWLDTHELIQVGYAWRLTDVPTPHGVNPIKEGNTTPSSSPELQKLLAELDTLDKAPVTFVGAGKDDKAAQYNLKRVAVLEKIAPLVEEKERDNWVRQICDNLSTAIQAGNDAAQTQLAALRADLAKKSPTSNLVPYATYREMWAKFSKSINSEKITAKEMAELQEKWLDDLAKFVSTYPKADDTADALHQLAMGSEYAGKDAESKRWYQQIYTQFPAHPYAEKAKGAERRLDLIGREMELNADPINGGAKFNLANAKGKVVVVYYWSSTVSVCSRDFAILKTIQAGHGAKGLEIVTINLDDRKDDAVKFLAANALIGTHIGEYGKESGLSSPLATQYGINSLPTVFIIGRDGRVVNRTVQVNDLEDALKKAL